MISLNLKQTKTRLSKQELRTNQMRVQLWPSVPEDHLWDRTKASGFTTMPRTMPHLINIIDSLTNGQPAGMTYLTIWCRLFVAGVLELPTEKRMSQEAGFNGERSVDTWRKRMKLLKEFGFIDYKSGGDHDFQWVLVYNPHHVVQRLGNKIQEKLRTAWTERAIEVGAKDISALPSG